MRNKTIQVNLNGTELSAASGTTICELLSRINHKGPLPPLGAIANRRLTGLYRTLTADAVVTTLDYNSKQGAFIYRRSLCLLFLAAAKELYPQVRVEIGQSLGEGYFIELDGTKVTAKTVEKLLQAMVHYVEKDIPYILERVYVDEAASYFESVGAINKFRYLTQLPRSEIRLVSLLDFKDILHGPVTMSTGCLKNFKLEKYKHGLLLSFPTREGKVSGESAKDNHKLLFESFSETRDWNSIVGVSNISDLNEACIRGTIYDLIKINESLHEKKIAQIADTINHCRKLPRVILVAGPSSSGKTTFSQRLSVQLKVNGITPCTLSMDNYYVDRKKTPLHEDGTYNFESVHAIDLKLFNNHLERIISGELVHTPVYSFNTGKRAPNREIPIKLGPRNVLIIEGIHALNDILHSNIDKSDKFGIFVSALSQLSIDEHNRIFTSDTRLIRRMVRDRLFRGYSAAQTLSGWLSVRAGEDKYIFPYQGNANVMFNSALVYEHAVLKIFAKHFLLEVSRDSEEFTEAERLYHFLDYFIPIVPKEIPPTSVLREFIGGSTFNY